MSRKRLLLESIAVIAIIGAMLSFVLPAIRAAREASLFPDGPYGELIPSEPPHASKRIQHATGISIVMPPNWQLFDRGSSVQIAARHRRGGMRLQSFITITSADPMDTELAGWERTSFQGHTAYEQPMHVERKATFDDPAFSKYSLCVNASGTWWLVEFGVAQERVSLPREIAAYIDTIQFNSNATKSK